MFIIIVKYIIIVHCYRRIIACKFTDYPALRSPAHPNEQHLHLPIGRGELTNIRDNVACGGALLQGVPTLLPKIHTYPHLKGIYLSIETYIPLIRNLYTFRAKPIYLLRSGCIAVERGVGRRWSVLTVGR